MTVTEIDPLKPRQRAFVNEYLLDLNGTQAAIRAGYAAGSAHVQANRLLSNAKIVSEIEKAQQSRVERVEIDSDWVLKTLVDEHDADLADIYDDDGALLPIRDWPMIWRKGLVAGIEVQELFDGRGKDRRKIGTLTKVKLSDRVRRKELIGKHIKVGAFSDRVEVDPSDRMKEFMDAVSGQSIRPKGNT